MELIVPDDQYSKAIGRRGQNVRLAQHLTGWEVVVLSETKHAEMSATARGELGRIEALSPEGVELLIRHGFHSLAEVADAEAYDLCGVLSCEEEDAQAVIDSAEAALEKIILEEADQRKAGAELPPEA